jgi:putative ABC transport system substrate-binding protein
MTLLRATLAIGLLLALVCASLVADAQQTSGPARIGFLPLGSPANAYDRSLVEAFRQGLRDVGLVENRQVVLDVVWSSEPDYVRAVSEVLQRGARLLVPCGTSASLAAKRNAAGVPILFISVGNPVGIGLVESLSRPGGNTSGFSDVLADLSGKFVQFGQELRRPQAPLHYLWHTGWADGQYRLQGSDTAAQAAGLKLRARGIVEVGEINDAMAAMKKDGATAVIVQPSPFTYRQRGRIIESATDNGLATIFGFPPAAREGALVAYGPDYADLYRRAGSYVDRILKGARPADLPVEEPRKFELVINLKVAKALGVTVPPSLLLQASEIIR